MEERIIHYDYENLRVMWKPKTCIHSEKCWRGLPEVFKPKEKRWIQPENADSQKLKNQINQCPSGALSYQLIGETMSKDPSNAIQVQIIQDGPLMVSGEMEIIDKDGNPEIKAKAAFCRCGASANKPYCDGSHKKIEFKG